MPIWFNSTALDKSQLPDVGLARHIGIEFTQVGDDYLSARMPVDDRTRQPFGILHGGASVVLAETLGSMAAAMVVDSTKYQCVGQEINANHIRAISSGFVIGTARPVHLGRRSHVWEIRIVDEKDRLVCISRITMFIMERQPGDGST